MKEYVYSIYWKKKTPMYEMTWTVQTHIIQESTVVGNYYLPIDYR